MALPFFYTQHLDATEITLDEDTSKHITGVLRMKMGAELLLTDGQGKKAKAVIADDNRKRCTVQLRVVETVPEKTSTVSIALSLVKNATRFEWFLEKATEIGVSEIIPLLCARTEKEKFRHDRMQSIVTSAMLQSQQCWMPRLRTPAPLQTVLKMAYDHKYLAHCLPQHKQSLHGTLNKGEGSRLILIGPEGDFTESEIDQAVSENFVPVTLGNTRLRTETAGIVAATWLCAD